MNGLQKVENSRVDCVEKWNSRHFFVSQLYHNRKKCLLFLFQPLLSLSSTAYFYKPKPFYTRLSKMFAKSKHTQITQATDSHYTATSPHPNSIQQSFNLQQLITWERAKGNISFCSTTVRSVRWEWGTVHLLYSPR